MAVFPDGYAQVMRGATGGLQFMRAWHKEWAVPTTGAISPARDRPGEAPLKMLFERMAVPLAVAGTPGTCLGKRRLMAIYRVKLDVPDIPANISYTGQYQRRQFPQSGNSLVSTVMWFTACNSSARSPCRSPNWSSGPGPRRTWTACEISLPYVTHCWRCYRP
jgi:hypothetical protein